MVFYNGTSEQQDEMILRLSDSFPEGAVSDIEVRVLMLNVNYGKNQKLMKACKPLMEYSWLVAEIRKNNVTNDAEGFSSAIDHAITAMPDNFLIKAFLILHRTEVKCMLLTEYNEAETMELFKEEGREEEKLSNIKTIMETLKMTAQQAMNVLRISDADQKRFLSMLQ